MAVVSYFVERLTKHRDESHIVSWLNLTSTDSGTPIEMTGSADRSLQVTGTFGVGGSLRIEGSNDGSTYNVLTDPQGNALDVTSSKIETIIEIVRWIRPRVTAGDGDTSLSVYMLLRKTS